MSDQRPYTEQLGKQGPPMAFIHPIPMDNSCWLYQMAHFSSWFRTIGIDVPGWGRSPAVPGVTMTRGAQLCWEAIDEVSAEPTVLCGISVGCHLAIHMASMKPERTRAVILSGCGWLEGDALSTLNARYDMRAAAYLRDEPGYRYEHALYDFSPEFQQTELARYFATLIVERNQWGDRQTMADWFEALKELDPVDGVKAPTLIIVGSKDNSFATAPALQARINGSELAILEGAGHACNMEQPWQWDRYAIDFLERLGILDRGKRSEARG